jgi:hypothetical protein
MKHMIDETEIIRFNAGKIMATFFVLQMVEKFWFFGVNLAKVLSRNGFHDLKMLLSCSKGTILSEKLLTDLS